MSNTIDLESTLIRAEALFHLFERLVQSIDKKQNFPGPKVRQRVQTASSPGPTTDASNATSSGNDAAVGNAAPKGKGRKSEEAPPVQKKTISPELRDLLSRKVEILPRKVVQKKGEGLATVKK